MLHDPGEDAIPVWHLHRHGLSRLGEMRSDEPHADRAPQRGRYAAGGDPTHDSVLTLHDLARLGWNDRGVVRLYADEPVVVVPPALPRQLRFAGEVLFVHLDRPVETGAVGPREPVRVLAEDRKSVV